MNAVPMVRSRVMGALHAGACVAVLTAIIAGTPSGADAQIRASEMGTVSQVIDGTKFTITYSRPRTRGRNPLFGTKAAHWGETWTPGANWATTLEVSRDVTVGGRAVAKGKYSLWMVLREVGDWTLVLDPDWHRYHMEPPDSTAQQVRIAVRVSQAENVDVLTWSFPELTVSGGTLAMQWGTTRATTRVSVQPSLSVTMPEADARAYVGRYRYTWMTKPDSGKTITFNVTYENGTLKGQWDPNDDYMGTFALIRVAPDWFVPGLYDEKGEIYEVLRPEMVLSFARVGGRVMTFEVRDENDVLQARGARKDRN